MKTYKVRNDVGDTFEVDAEKIGDAEKDGYLPIVSNGKQEHRVSMSDVSKAEKDGYQVVGSKGFLQSTGDFINAASESMSDMMPGKGIIEKIGNTIPSAVEYVYDRLPGDLPLQNPQSYSDTYSGNLKAAQEMGEKTKAKSTAGTVVGTGMGLVTGMKVPGVGKSAPTRILGNAALSAIDSGTRGEDVIDLDAAGEAALMSGGISATLEAIPVIGKGVKALNKASGGNLDPRRLIPGSEVAADWVNKGTAKAASLIPGTDIEASHLEELLSDTSARRAARKLKEPGVLDKVANDASDLFNEVDKVTNKQVSLAYAKGQGELLEKVGEKDLPKFDFTSIDQIKDMIDQKPEFFGRASKVVNQVDDILKSGGPKEIGKITQDMPLSFLVKNLPGDQAAVVQTQRLLNARRHIDDVVKNVDFEKMLHSEQEAIKATRGAINDQIERLTGSEALRSADKTYAQYVPAKKDAFFKLQVPLPSGGREINPESAMAFLKSDKAQSKFIENKLNDLGEIMGKFDVDGANTVKDLNETVIKSVRENFSTLSALENLKRATGGPTSQAINTAMQIVGAGYSGGSTLILMPITNPSAWMKLVDAAEPQVKPLLDKITTAARKVTKDNPQFAARLYMTGKQYQENDKN